MSNVEKKREEKESMRKIEDCNEKRNKEEIGIEKDELEKVIKKNKKKVEGEKVKIINRREMDLDGEKNGEKIELRIVEIIEKKG